VYTTRPHHIKHKTLLPKGRQHCHFPMKSTVRKLLAPKLQIYCHCNTIALLTFLTTEEQMVTAILYLFSGGRK